MFAHDPISDDTELSADAARQLCTRDTNALDVNFTLTIRRLYRVIRSAARQGCTELTFTAPSLVLDGCCQDPIILAKALRRKLLDLGYQVKRKEDRLYVNWGKVKD